MLKEFEHFIKTEKDIALIELITVKGSSPKRGWCLDACFSPKMP